MKQVGDGVRHQQPTADSLGTPGTAFGESARPPQATLISLLG